MITAVRPAGERAVLVDVDDLATVHRLAASVLAAGIAEDVVPGWRTVLVIGDHPDRLADAVQRLALVTGPDVASDRPIRVEVRYDGPDLDEVARLVGLPVDDVIAIHSGATYTVAFLGFSRGFPYLDGLPPELDVPRLSTPRLRVPAGSVAIAGRHAGIYPLATPGGWRILGRTDMAVFDPDRFPPSAFAPGATVRFVPV